MKKRLLPSEELQDGVLLAEVAAATAVVSESALVYVAPKRNLMLSVLAIGLQAGISFALITMVTMFNWPSIWYAAAVSAGLVLSLALNSLFKAWLLSRMLGHSVNCWRWALAWAVAGAMVAGAIAVRLPEWAEIIVGIPAILAIYGWIMWNTGFGPADRALFRKQE